ncbi:MAG: hypothetical protein AB7R89_07745 [Dehalococcoidia bacterium]
MSAEARITFHGIEPVEGVLYEPLLRKAHVLGTGLEVFEIVRTWLNVKRDWKGLTDAYHWLTGDQLNAALEFYAKNPAMVDARLAREREARVEDVWERNPKSRPPRR